MVCSLVLVDVKGKQLNPLTSTCEDENFWSIMERESREKRIKGEAKSIRGYKTLQGEIANQIVEGLLH